jgi:hypothetical protein
MRVPSPFRPYPLQGKARFGAGPAPQAVPFALIIPMPPVFPPTWVATRTVRRLPPTVGLPPSARPANTQAACCRSRPETTLGSRPSGVDSQTRPVRPTSPVPPLTNVPALRQAALGLGTRLPFCAPLRASTERMHRPRPEGLGQPSSPDDPRAIMATLRSSRPPLAGPPGLAWLDLLTEADVLEPGWVLWTGVAPGYPSDAKPPSTMRVTPHDRELP